MGVEHTCFDQILFLAIYTGSLDLRRGGGADISDPVACFVAGPDCYWGYEHGVVKDRFDGNEAAYLHAGLGRGGGKGGAQKTSFFKSPRIWCFGVLIAFIEGAKGPYKVTALKST